MDEIGFKSAEELNPSGDVLTEGINNLLSLLAFGKIEVIPFSNSRDLAFTEIDLPSLKVSQGYFQAVQLRKYFDQMSPWCSRLSSTPSPMMPSFLVIDGPTRSGVNSITESALNSAVRRSSGSSTR